MRVLIAEDDSLLAEGLARSLRDSGYAVDCVNTGAEADSATTAVERIEAGEFPPRPKRPAECQWCRYSGVCRKEYLIEDDAAEPV